MEDTYTLIIAALVCLALYWFLGGTEGMTNVTPPVAVPTATAAVPTPDMQAQTAYDPFQTAAEQITPEMQNYLTPQPIVGEFLKFESNMKIPNAQLRPDPPIVMFSDQGFFNQPGDFLPDTNRNLHF